MFGGCFGDVLRYVVFSFRMVGRSCGDTRGDVWVMLGGCLNDLEMLEGCFGNALGDAAGLLFRISYMCMFFLTCFR